MSRADLFIHYVLDHVLTTVHNLEFSVPKISQGVSYLFQILYFSTDNTYLWTVFTDYILINSNSSVRSSYFNYFSTPFCSLYCGYLL